MVSGVSSNNKNSEAEEQDIYRQHFDDVDSDGGDSDKEEENKNERMVVRFVPKAVDYVIGFL